MENLYPKSINYIKHIIRVGKPNPFLQSILEDKPNELHYLEYFIDNLVNKLGGEGKLKEAIANIPDDEFIDMTHHHWRSFMSELTAYWILETRMDYSIEKFDASSPFRKRIGSNCDAVCLKETNSDYIEVKSAHDWTRFSPPRSIVDLCKSFEGFQYRIAVNEAKHEVTKEFLNFIRTELLLGRKYLNNVPYEASYEISSPDNKEPHGVTITMQKWNDKYQPIISFGFPPRNDEDFGEWLKLRIQEANEKGATILFVNYIFWTEIGETPSIDSFLKKYLIDLEKNNNELNWKYSYPTSIKKIVVFMPSGNFVPIELI
jgi:hypothetical protein